MSRNRQPRPRQGAVAASVSYFALGERYQHGQGLLYRVDPRVKIVIAVAFAFAITVVHAGHWQAFAGFGAFVALAVGTSRLPLWLVLRRSLIALPFAAAAFPLIFTKPGDTIFTVPLLGWAASHEGLVHVGSIMLKSWLAVLLAVVLTSCTRPLDLIRGLERLRLPRVLAGTIFFMYRYLHVIGEEGHRLMRARDARSASGPDGGKSGGSVLWRARVLGSMVGSLFVRSLERSERIYAAMQSRGYDGTVRFSNERRLARRDWGVLLVAVLALGGLIIYARF
ncbi:MAG: cobalt ECF transporter T component CbiQ [Chloroflexi bacterium]|nr:MAG: cobalt ECF transporter T component CbiQ [Chloroflexota bacterium]